MRKANFVIGSLAAAASALALVGCDVDKKQEGNVSVPKYEVQKTQEGNVTLPKYDVTTPDVQVGSTQKEVTVPKVTTEKETVTLPDVDLKTADEKKAEQQANAGSSSNKQ
jgi:predicted RecA/RadA family phage recombinase